MGAALPIPVAAPDSEPPLFCPVLQGVPGCPEIWLC